jgi:2-methylisocitrate lyase-like PEP mutase family enzyme
MTSDARAVFRDLHTSGLFVMPNPWDAGSARLLATLGFPALATTSSGHAATLGRRDQQVSRDELLTHAASLAAAVDVPLSVDADTVRLIAQTGAAGCSIEDYDPATGAIDSIELTTERVAAAADAAHAHGLVLTARTERHLYGGDDLDATVAGS